MRPSQVLTLISTAAIIVALVGCDELIDENGPTYDSEINSNCEDYCSQEVECFDLPESSVETCISECVDRTHTFRREHSQSCFETELDAMECEVTLNCHELEDPGTYCGSEFSALEQACDL